METIYTIGYAGFEIESFLKALKEHGITVLIDVRSSPVASEYYKAYSKDVLEPLLKSNNILYRNYSAEFGARQTNKDWFTNGYLDFKKFTNTDNFKSGVKKIKDGMALNYKFVLMCAEKDPINCHRTIMISKALQDLGFQIKHILPNDLETQEELNKRLLKLYFPNSSLFDDEQTMLEESYRLQNEKIGFKEKDIK